MHNTNYSYTQNSYTDKNSISIKSAMTKKMYDDGNLKLVLAALTSPSAVSC